MLSGIDSFYTILSIPKNDFIAWFLTALSIDKYLLGKVKTPIILLICMLVVGALGSIIEGSSVSFNRAINSTPNFAWLIVGIFHIEHTDLLKKSIWIILAMFVVSAIYTIIGNIAYPEASRILAGVQTYYTSTRAMYRAMNIGGYGFIYALVFLVMPLIYFAKMRRKTVLLLIAIIALLVSTVFVSAYMIGIVLVVLSLLIALPETQNNGKLIFIIAVLALGIYIFRDKILGFLTMIGENINSEILVERANQLMTGEYVNEYGDNNNRLTIYMNSIRNWLDRPFFGALEGGEIEYRRSGHSSMFGYLEKYGVLAVIFFAYFKRGYDVVKYRLANLKTQKIYFIFYLFAMIFITIDNFDTFIELGCVIFFVAPVLFVMADRKLSEKGGIGNENTVAYQ